MKLFAYASFGAAVMFLAAVSPAQTKTQDLQSQAAGSFVQKAPPASATPPKISYGSGKGAGFTDELRNALAHTGRFNTFLALWDAARMDDWERAAKAGIQEDSVRGKTAFEDLGLHGGVTILAPNDAAFAKMDKAKLEALMKDQAAARAFVLAHTIDRPLKVNDLFFAGNPTSEKQFKSAGGGEFKVQCNGMPHVGLHHPLINGGMARVGELQDVSICCGVVQEIDGVLAR